MTARSYDAWHSLSILMAIFPGELGLASLIEAKDDGSDDDNWSYKSYKAPVKQSPPMNQLPWHSIKYNLITMQWLNIDYCKQKLTLEASCSIPQRTCISITRWFTLKLVSCEISTTNNIYDYSQTSNIYYNTCDTIYARDTVRFML